MGVFRRLVEQETHTGASPGFSCLDGSPGMPRMEKGEESLSLNMPIRVL